MNIQTASASTKTVRIYSEVGDGAITSGGVGRSWEAVRSGDLFEPVNFTSPERNVYTDVNRAGWHAIRRLYFPFDTSIVPEDAGIITATFGVVHPHNQFKTHDDLAVGVLIGRQTNKGELSNEDWVPNSFTRAASDIDMTVFNSENLMVGWNLNAHGIDSIQTGNGAVTSIVLATSADIDDDSSVLTSTNYVDVYMSEAPGTSTDPYLEITYTVSEEPQTLTELLGEMIDLVENSDFDKQVKNSYLAHLKKIEDFYDFGRYVPAKNQLNQFVAKLIKDAQQGDITGEQFSELLVLANDVLTLLQEVENEEAGWDVPLITQVSSPYPSIPETESWANNSYASGTAASSCGVTIRQCGCALASMAMLAHSYGVTKGIDGKEINPGNLNEWLVDNNGYTSYGGALWGKVLEYFGKKNGEKITTNFSLTKHNATSSNEIGMFLNEVGPVVAFNNSLGHFFVLTGIVEDGYGVRDPFWYETQTTNDSKDILKHIQGYNNVVSKANLFTYSNQPHQLASIIEVHLGSPAELLLIDGEGKRVGYDAVDGLVTEIPNGSYDQSASIFTDASVSDPHMEKVLMVTDPDINPYELQVIGTDSGTYSLTVYTVDQQGDSQAVTYASSTASGLVHTYIIDLSSGDRDSGHGNESDDCDEDNMGEGGECTI